MPSFPLTTPVDWKLVVAIVAAIVSCFAAALTWVAARRARFIQFLTVLQKHLADIRAWADQVCDTMSEAAMLCDLDPMRTTGPDFFSRRHAIRIRLSSLLDRGRWFFPNTDQFTVGSHKHSAYRGLRVEALDNIADFLLLVEGMDYQLQAPNSAKRKNLVDLKKLFVAAIQDALDPRARMSEMTKARC